jgi:hypothetical protein
MAVMALEEEVALDTIYAPRAFDQGWVFPYIASASANIIRCNG